MVELLCCPFCGPETDEGSRVVLLAKREADGYARGYTVRCDHCGIELHDEYESDAVSAWNRRSSVQEATPSPAPAYLSDAQLDALAICGHRTREDAVAARAVAPAGVPEGVANLPKEPPQKALKAIWQALGWRKCETADQDARAVYSALRRALLSASPTPTAQPTSILWCAHVQGPDEVHPARDYDHAVEMCNMFNAISEQCNFGFKPDDMRYVRSVAYPAIWPWDAASHAEGLPSATSAGEATKPLTHCAAGKDGDCIHPECPQLRDGEPAKSRRHCPLDTDEED